MDWTGAIETNQRALTCIVAALIAAVGLASGSTEARLPKPLYHAALWVLRKAEAAVRRLIVMAARGLKVKLGPPRPMPEGLVIAGKGEGRHSFQLFDTRKRFAPPLRERTHVFAASPLSPLYHAQPVEKPVSEPDDGSVGATRLLRRLAALKLALKTLPHQAKRLARWKARRARMQGFISRSPLRPGLPPGHRKKAKDEIDFVLRECHGLAWDALREDTS